MLCASGNEHCIFFIHSFVVSNIFGVTYMRFLVPFLVHFFYWQYFSYNSMLFGSTVVNCLSTVGIVISSSVSFSWCKRALLLYVSLCGLFRVLYGVLYIFWNIFALAADAVVLRMLFGFRAWHFGLPSAPCTVLFALQHPWGKPEYLGCFFCRTEVIVIWLACVSFL